MTSPKIEIQNVTFVYGKDPSLACRLLAEGKSSREIFQSTGMTIGVQNASLDVYPEEILVIMGLSGSGKSTLLKCLNLLLRPCQGSILVDGENILDYDKKQLRRYRQQKTCMVFQEFGLLPHRTVLQNVEFGLEVEKVPKPQRHETASRVIKTVGLSGWENSYPKELSGGMQQRVGLARALANEPDILLMDEPFSALDPLIRRQMQQELLELQRKLRKVIVFITHDINEAFCLGDRIAIMKDASIQQIGSPNEILRQPATDYVAEFIRDVNKLQVLCCGDIMDPYPAESIEGTDIPHLTRDQSLEHALRLLEHYCGPAPVLDDDGLPCGCLRQEQILDILIHGM